MTQSPWALTTTTWLFSMSTRACTFTRTSIGYECLIMDQDEEQAYRLTTTRVPGGVRTCRQQAEQSAHSKCSHKFLFNIA